MKSSLLLAMTIGLLILLIITGCSSAGATTADSGVEVSESEYSKQKTFLLEQFYNHLEDFNVLFKESAHETLRMNDME